MKYLFIYGLLLISTAGSCIETVAGGTSTLVQPKWNHGSMDCASNTDPAMQVFRHDPSTYILRQNKCLSFEAPFIYLLIGEQKALVLDTGATESAEDFPLYKTVLSIVKEQSDQAGKAGIEILVIHSHSHSDHYAGDPQFEGKPGVTLVKPNASAVKAFFGFEQWPKGEANIELGGRKLSIIPTPGHQEQAISVFDPHTKWLLTGDSFYPGYVYVKNWKDYKNSIARLAAVADRLEVSAVLGAHIEMTDTAGEFYPIGSTYQPHETSLVLRPELLGALNVRLQATSKANKIEFSEFIVAPMNWLQKSISKIAGWIIN